ncbi:MAG: hypothetical protein D6758_13835 [Gammaproteobacteria bacterium]|nr:MAG: hypothetical protein D6758_13835 [Gammaproteobacteria bacterium]
MVKAALLKVSVILFALGGVLPVRAELKALDDEGLSAVEGKGLGLVFEDFVFEHTDDSSRGQIFRIEGIKSAYGASKGQDVVVAVNQLYIARSGSDYGGTLNPVNLGRLKNPFNIDVLDGDSIGVEDKAVLEIRAPQQHAPDGTRHKDMDFDGAPDPVYAEDGSPLRDVNGNIVLRDYNVASAGFDCFTGAAGGGLCDSRTASAAYENGERPDLGMKFSVKVGSHDADSLNIHAKAAVIDGTRLRVWGEGNKMVGEFHLNFYTPELMISTCEDGGASCGKALKFRNFLLELPLGNAHQPMAMNVNGSGNFVYEIKSIAQAAQDKFGVTPTQLPSALGWSGGGTRSAAQNKALWDWFNDYYQDPANRGNLYIGKLEVHDTGGVHDFGSSRIENLLIQYMKITSHDLMK